MAQTDTPPIAYPTLEIGGRTYSLKFALGARYRLELAGVNASNISAGILQEIAAGRNISLVLKLAAAALGTQDGGTWIPAGLTAEALADSLPEARLGEVGAAVLEALVKAYPPPAKAPTAAGEQATGPRKR